MDIGQILGSLDLNTIIAAALSFILGIGVVAKYLIKAKSILKEVLHIIVSLSKALEDDKLSADEIKELVKESQDLLDCLKGKLK